MSFTTDLEAFKKRTIRKYETIYRSSVFDLFTSVVFSTPVDKGVLRNNWFVTIGKASVEQIEATGEPISRGRSVLKALRSLDTVFLTNNLPYAVPIEFDGYSAQAPEGMVRVNTVRWDAIVRNNVRKIGRGF